MTTGERIKQRRKSFGISAEALASYLGISPASVYRYEKGEIEKCPSDFLIPIAEYLHTTPSYLIGLTDDPEAHFPSPLNNDPLTPAELSLLSAYRHAPQEIRTIVDTALAPYGEKSAVSEPSAG